MKLTKHQSIVARRLEAGDMLKITWNGVIYKGRALRHETELQLRRHFGNELIQITTKGKHCHTDWLTLRKHVALINDTMTITRIETHLRFHTEFAGH